MMPMVTRAASSPSARIIFDLRSGNRRDWWEPSDDREFLNRTSCLEDQYADFTIQHQGRDFSIDRNSRQGENIADNGAAKVAYM